LDGVGSRDATAWAVWRSVCEGHGKGNDSYDQGEATEYEK
jgi:hypothetical protein